MNISDIFKKSFIEGFSSELTIVHIIISLAVTCILSLYLFFVYRFITRKTFYSKNFNISLVSIAIITAAIILTIQSSVVISLGMVGALSIVRFRTPIKDPMDLTFLFWALSIGIICGAGLAEIAVVTSLLLTALIFILNRLQINKAPLMVVINANNSKIEDSIIIIIEKYCKYYKVKSRNYTSDNLDIIIEVRLHEERACISEISELPGIISASLLSHDGEVTF